MEFVRSIIHGVIELNRKIVIFAVIGILIGTSFIMSDSEDSEATPIVNATELKGSIFAECKGHSTKAFGEVNVSTTSGDFRLFTYNLYNVYGGDQILQINGNWVNLFWELNTNVTLYWQAWMDDNLAGDIYRIEIRIWINSETMPNDAYPIYIDKSSQSQFTSVSVSANGSGSLGTDTTVLTVTNYNYPSVSTSVTGSNIVNWDCRYVRYTVTFVSSNTDYGNVSVVSIVVNPNSTVTIGATNTATVNNNGSVTTVTATATQNTDQYAYSFNGWFLNGNRLSPSDILTVTSDITLTADFSRHIKNYTVNFDTNNEYGNISTSILHVPYGTAVSISGNTVTVGSYIVTATPLTDTAQYTYSFTEWTGATDTTVITQGISLTANFSRVLNTYTVTIQSNNTEWGTVSSGSITDIPYGTIPAIQENRLTIGEYEIIATPTTATESTYYWLSEWQDVDTVTGNMTFTAEFDSGIRMCVITFSSNDYGNTNYVTLNVPYGSNITVNGNELTLGTFTVIATPIEPTTEYQYVFSSWIKTGVGTDTVTEDGSFAAVFNRAVRQYTVTFVTDKPYGEWSSQTISVPYGAAVRIESDSVRIGGSTNNVVFNDTSSYRTNKVDSIISTLGDTVESDGTITAYLSRTTTIPAYSIINPENAGEVTVEKDGPWQLIKVLPIILLVGIIYMIVAPSLKGRINRDSTDYDNY